LRIKSLSNGGDVNDESAWNTRKLHVNITVGGEYRPGKSMGTFCQSILEFKVHRACK
jgi:hypothetical protein